MFFCMAGARPLEFGFELIAYNAMERGIGHVESELLSQPVLDSQIAGKAGGGGQARLELREHGRRQGLLASRCPASL
jgi:hypothetical protein